MESEAGIYNQNAAELESMMKRRNCKLYFILGCVVVAILVYIIVAIARACS